MADDAELVGTTQSAATAAAASHEDGFKRSKTLSARTRKLFGIGEKRNPEPVKLKRAVEELLQTERNFLQDLQSLHKGYESKLPAQVLRWEERSVVFRNLTDLISLHETLLASLQPACEQADLCLIANSFITTDFLSFYASFCPGHESALQKLESLQANPLFQEKLLECQVALNNKLSLADDLIKPIQRILKYPLLLSEISRHAPNDGPALDQLRAALLHMQKVAVDVNRIKRQRELDDIIHGQVVVTRTQTLQDRMAAGGFEGNIASYGSLVEEASGVTIAAGKQRGSARHLYLFEMALLACKARPDGSIAVKDLYLLQSCTVEEADGHSFSIVDTLYPDSKTVYQSQRMDAPQWVARCRDLIRLLPASPRSPVAARPHLAASRSFSSFLPNKRDRKTERAPSSPSARRLAQTAAAAVAAAYGSGPNAGSSQTPLSPAGRSVQSFSALTQTSARHAGDNARGSSTSTPSQPPAASTVITDDESALSDAHEQPVHRADMATASSTKATETQADLALAPTTLDTSQPAALAYTPLLSRDDADPRGAGCAPEPPPPPQEPELGLQKLPTGDDGSERLKLSTDIQNKETADAPRAGESQSRLTPLAAQLGDEPHEAGERRDRTPQSIDLGQTDDEHGPDTSDGDDSDRGFSPLNTGLDESFEVLSAQSRSDSSNNVVDSASAMRHGSHGSASDAGRGPLHPHPKSADDDSHAERERALVSTPPASRMQSHASPQRAVPLPGQAPKLVLSLHALDGHSEVDAETDEAGSKSLPAAGAVDESEVSGGDVADPELGSLLPAPPHATIVGSAAMKLFAGAAAALLSKSPGPLTAAGSGASSLTPIPVAAASRPSPPKLAPQAVPASTATQSESSFLSNDSPSASQLTPTNSSHGVSPDGEKGVGNVESNSIGGDGRNRPSSAADGIITRANAAPSTPLAGNLAMGSSAAAAESHALVHTPTTAAAADSTPNTASIQDDSAQVPMRRAAGRQSSAFTAVSTVGPDRSPAAAGTAAQASGTDEVLAERELSDVTLHRKGRIRSLLFKPPSLTDPAANVNLEAYVLMVTQGLLSPSVLLDKHAIRGHALYLTRFRKRYEPCWLTASITTRSVCLYTGPDERHAIRSLRWADLIQAVGTSRDCSFHIVMVNRTHHLRALDEHGMRLWVCALNSVTDSQ